MCIGKQADGYGRDMLVYIAYIQPNSYRVGVGAQSGSSLLWETKNAKWRRTHNKIVYLEVFYFMFSTLLATETMRLKGRCVFFLCCCCGWSALLLAADERRTHLDDDWDLKKGNVVQRIWFGASWVWGGEDENSWALLKENNNNVVVFRKLFLLVRNCLLFLVRQHRLCFSWRWSSTTKVAAYVID